MLTLLNRIMYEDSSAYCAEAVYDGSREEMRHAATKMNPR